MIIDEGLTWEDGEIVIKALLQRIKNLTSEISILKMKLKNLEAKKMNDYGLERAQEEWDRKYPQNEGEEAEDDDKE